MQGYNFTERVRKSLAFAREEAALLHHEYVGTEHILLGLVREGEGVASAVLENLNVKLDTIREAIEAVVQKGKATGQTRPDLPYTSRAKKVLELAMLEARNLGHKYVGTEHVLLGLLREEKGIAAQVLVSLGVTIDRARGSVRDSIAGDPSNNRSGDSPDADDMYGFAQLKSPGFDQTRWLLTISAALAAVIGLSLIFNARGFEAQMGIVIDDWTETIAQAQGAILLGLGVINWLARGVRDRSALWAILYGNFVVQTVSLAIVARALVHGFIPPAGIGAAAMHVLLAAAFGWQLVQLKRSR